MFFPLRFAKSEAETKQAKVKKNPYCWVVKSETPGFFDLEYQAFTKSEARAQYKREYGKVPPGTIFTKVV